MGTEPFLVKTKCFPSVLGRGGGCQLGNVNLSPGKSAGKGVATSRRAPQASSPGQQRQGTGASLHRAPAFHLALPHAAEVQRACP